MRVEPDPGPLEYDAQRGRGPPRKRPHPGDQLDERATLVIGAIAGLYPAVRASRLDPVDALSSP